MIGKAYKFEGCFLDGIYREERLYTIKDAKMHDSFTVDEQRTIKHPNCRYLINLKGVDKWTKPIPVTSINLKLKIT